MLKINFLFREIIIILFSMFINKIEKNGFKRVVNFELGLNFNKITMFLK